MKQGRDNNQRNSTYDAPVPLLEYADTLDLSAKLLFEDNDPYQPKGTGYIINSSLVSHSNSSTNLTVPFASPVNPSQKIPNFTDSANFGDHYLNYDIREISKVSAASRDVSAVVIINASNPINHTLNVNETFGLVNSTKSTNPASFDMTNESQVSQPTTTSNVSVDPLEGGKPILNQSQSNESNKTSGVDLSQPMSRSNDSEPRNIKLPCQKLRDNSYAEQEGDEINVANEMFSDDQNNVCGPSSASNESSTADDPAVHTLLYKSLMIDRMSNSTIKSNPDEVLQKPSDEMKVSIKSINATTIADALITNSTEINEGIIGNGSNAASKPNVTHVNMLVQYSNSTIRYNGNNNTDEVNNRKLSAKDEPNRNLLASMYPKISSYKILFENSTTLFP